MRRSMIVLFGLAAVWNLQAGQGEDDDLYAGLGFASQRRLDQEWKPKYEFEFTTHPELEDYVKTRPRVEWSVGHCTPWKGHLVGSLFVSDSVSDEPTRTVTVVLTTRSDQATYKEMVRVLFEAEVKSASSKGWPSEVGWHDMVAASTGSDAREFGFVRADCREREWCGPLLLSGRYSYYMDEAAPAPSIVGIGVPLEVIGGEGTESVGIRRGWYYYRVTFLAGAAVVGLESLQGGGPYGWDNLEVILALCRESGSAPITYRKRIIVQNAGVATGWLSKNAKPTLPR